MLEESLTAADPDQREGDRGGGVEKVNSLHALHSPSRRTAAQVAAAAACILASTLVGISSDAVASQPVRGMARVMVMLPIPTILQLEQTRDETKVAVSTQCRVLIMKAMRNGHTAT